MNSLSKIQHDPNTLAQPYCAAYVFLKKEDKYFFLRRVNTGYHDGLYGVPAGKLDVGETIYDCAIREAKEEAGVTVSRDDLTFLGTAQRFDPTSSKYPHWIDFFFSAEVWEGTAQNMEADKADDFGWFTLDELKGKVAPNQYDAILNVETEKVLIQHENENGIKHD